MPNRSSFIRLSALLAVPLLISCSDGQTATEASPVTGQLSAQPDTASVTAAIETLPELQGGNEVDVLVAIQQGIHLPFGTPVPALDSRVVVRLVVGEAGYPDETTIVQGISPAVDEAVLVAMRDLSPWRVGVGTYSLTVVAPGALTPTQRREATTRWQQTARRLPGEADSTFVRRVLPLSYPEDAHDLLAYAWRPNAFGKQLFFSRRGAPNEYGTKLFVLDPYQLNTYAVQVLPVDDMGDFTYPVSLFFADANRNGNKDLLVLAQCDLRETVEYEGQQLTGRVDHYRTDIWQYTAPDETGRPRYQLNPTPRPYLDDLPTAAEVRRALARRLATKSHSRR